jgi:hypothetical protein
LELAAEKEEEADNMSFVDLCEQIEALERRVIVQRMHIQQDQVGSRCRRSIPAQGAAGRGWT